MNEYNSELVLEAWKQAVNYGIIDESKLRPEIARSWARCISYGLDPWSPFKAQRDDELLQEMRKKHATLIESASPVLQYLLTVFNCNVCLADMNSFVFELVTPLSRYPRTLGTFATEELCGNGNITIATNERKPYRVDGYEHYHTHSQTYSGVAAFINGVKGEDFVLCMTNPFIALPQSALDVCIAAGKLIEKLSRSRKETFMQLSSATFFDPIIENDRLAVIVTDQDGTVLTANTLAKHALPEFDKRPYASSSLREYLRNKQDFCALLENPAGLKMQNIDFRGKNRESSISMRFIRSRRVDLVNGTSHNILVLSPESRGKEDKVQTMPSPNFNRKSDDCLGESEAWRKVEESVCNAAPYGSNVIITGETGTGKEVVARELHRMSGRKGEFVAINCGGIPRELLASELFGYEKGAFTGANPSGSIGKFEFANGGTLFLDEIGEMPADMQTSLLRVLQERRITRIGANKSVPVDVRIVAATNRDLRKLIGEGLFREDLWYRLSVVEISLPRLRDRHGDIPLLAEHFNKVLSKSLNMEFHPLSADVLQFLDRYNWPGNVRELKNAIEKALITAKDGPIQIEHFPEYMKNQNPEHGGQYKKENADEKNDASGFNADAKNPGSLKLYREMMEKEKIKKVLEEEAGNISRSAKRLNMSRDTLYRKIKKWEIQLEVRAKS